MGADEQPRENETPKKADAATASGAAPKPDKPRAPRKKAAKPEAKSEAKSEAKPRSKPEAKPEARSEAESPEAKGAEADAPRTEGAHSESAPAKPRESDGRPRRRRPRPPRSGNRAQRPAPEVPTESSGQPLVGAPLPPELPEASPLEEFEGDPPAPLDLAQLKAMSIQELNTAAVEMGLADAAGLKKHDLIFRMLHTQARRRGVLFAEGVLEILPDGFGFLRAPDSNYLPGPDDIYVSPSQIRRFDLRTGDTVSRPGPPPQGGRAVLRPAQGRGRSTSTSPRRRRTRSSSTT